MTRRLRLWHRYVGLSLAGVALVLASTGILLNHSADLELDTQYISWSPLLDWYDFPVPKIDKSFQVDAEHWLSLISGHLYLQQQALNIPAARLQAAVSLNGLICVLSDQRLLLLDQQGQLIESIRPQQGLPTAAQNLAISPQGWLRLQTATQIYQADADLLTWQIVTDRLENDWQIDQTAPTSLQLALQQQARSRLLHWERLLLDLHNGRFFGRLGSYVLDLVGLLLMVLAISGFFMWSKRAMKS